MSKVFHVSIRSQYIGPIEFYCLPDKVEQAIKEALENAGEDDTHVCEQFLKAYREGHCSRDGNDRYVICVEEFNLLGSE